MKTLLFDLDGTLLNSLEDIAFAANAVLTAHGYPVHPLTEYRQLVGNGFYRLISNALPPQIANTISENTLTVLVTEARSWYKKNMFRATQPYAGIIDTLSLLSDAGHMLSILSNKPHELTVALVEHFFPHVPFSIVLGAREGVPLKPDPTVPREMLHAMGGTANEAFYIGDSDVDILTARNAGMTSIGVAWGFRGIEELRAANADHIISVPAELATVVEG